MADKAVKSVTQLSDGNVIVTYTDLSTKKMSALKATEEIKQAKLANAYVKGDQTPGTGAASCGLKTIPFALAASCTD